MLVKNKNWHHRSRQQQSEKNTQPAGMQCSEPGVASAASDGVECINIVQEEEKPRFRQLPLTTDT